MEGPGNADAEPGLNLEIDSVCRAGGKFRSPQRCPFFWNDTLEKFHSHSLVVLAGDIGTMVLLLVYLHDVSAYAVICPHLHGTWRRFTAKLAAVGNRWSRMIGSARSVGIK